MKFFKNFWKHLTYFFKKDKNALDSFIKMHKFFFVQIPFTVAYWTSVLSYGISSEGAPEFCFFLSGANTVMFAVGLWSWWIIRNFQDCNASQNDYRKDNMLRFDICSCICILPCYIVTRPLFFKKYKRVNKITSLKSAKENQTNQAKEVEKS